MSSPANARSRVKFNGVTDGSKGKKKKKDGLKVKGKAENDYGSDTSYDAAKSMMDNLHNSYGSLNLSSSMLDLNGSSDSYDGSLGESFHGSSSRSFNTLNSSAESLRLDEFGTPKQSPWNIKLRTTPQKNASVRSITAPSLSPHRPIGDFDYSHSCTNTLLEEFSTPRQSPWRPPVKRMTKQTMSTVNLCEDPSETPTEASEISAKKKTTKKKKKGKEMVEKKIDKDTKKTTNKKAQDTTNILSTPVFTPLVSPGILKKPTVKKTLKNKSSPKLVKFAPAKAKYDIQHVKAATRIQALARAKRARLLGKFMRLQSRLGHMEKVTKNDIDKIRRDTEAAKADFKKRAHERYKKNLERKGKDDSVISENKDLIKKIRKENAYIRARNEKLHEAVKNLRINNARLESCNTEGSDYFFQLKHHEDTCLIEKKKLEKVNKSYLDAIEKHQEQLDLQQAYTESERKIKISYKTLLAQILKLVGESDDKELYEYLYELSTVVDDVEQEK
jgi:hypothetical protein